MNLPADLTVAVRWHHRPQEGAEANLATELVHLADLICLEQGIGAGRDGLQYRSSAAAAGRLRLKPSLCEQVACRVLGELEGLRRPDAVMER